ncbi:unnamed protein product [Protopolystoma xenopodis]|uniref:Uncharacterized protein n=1 Tax=Protopolystoma xenopodis TaxID=117903 RepID=A0A448X159_9PLAT|nr:unnamed protein product [Protopolystoma xenopodis]
MSDSCSIGSNLHSENEASSEETSSRNLIGPTFQSDLAVPSTGIGPCLPKHFACTSPAENILHVSNADEADPSTFIGPLGPGHELREEIRHWKEVDNSVVHF